MHVPATYGVREAAVATICGNTTQINPAQVC